MPTDAIPPRRVVGRYRVERLLGRGGSGAVWRAYDERLDRPVAVKEITVPVDGDEAAVGRSRALREARAAARLGGAGVVGIYDIVEDGGAIYLIMELVEAPNLGALVRRAGPLTPPTAALLGLRILDTLEAAHRDGIVHRDIKPSNVLIDGDRPRLADFGIARLGDDATLTTTGVVLGTPAYIAPEHARGATVGPAADLYGLGATLYYAVEGVPPFAAKGSVATVVAVLNDPPRPPERAGPLTTVLDDLLRKDPAARPDAATLRSRLREVASLGGAATTAGAARPPPEAGAAAVRGDGTPTGAVGHDVPRRTTRAQTRGSGPHPPGRDVAARGRRELLVVSVLAVLVLLGAWWRLGTAARDERGAVAGVASTPDRGSDLGAAAPTPTTSAVVDPATAPTEPRAPDEPPAAPPSPSARPSPSGGALPAFDDVEVPADWVVYDAADQPYSVAHPAGWEVVERSDTITDLRDPATGTYLRLDWVAARRDPVAAWEAVEAGLRARHEDYRRLRLVPTAYRGDPAALWEYRYRDGAVGFRAYNLGVNRGEFGFALNLQAREGRFDGARRLWPYFLASYRFQGR